MHLIKVRYQVFGPSVEGDGELLASRSLSILHRQKKPPEPGVLVEELIRLLSDDLREILARD